jgi:hypothetical protein
MIVAITTAEGQLMSDLGRYGLARPLTASFNIALSTGSRVATLSERASSKLIGASIRTG